MSLLTNRFRTSWDGSEVEGRAAAQVAAGGVGVTAPTQAATGWTRTAPSAQGRPPNKLKRTVFRLKVTGRWERMHSD